MNGVMCEHACHQDEGARKPYFGHCPRCATATEIVKTIRDLADDQPVYLPPSRRDA